MKPNHWKIITRKGKRTAGQGLLEFALAIGVFLFIVFGVIEFGYLMYVQSTLFSAAREAARYGSSVGVVDTGTGLTRDIDCAGIRAAAVRIGGLVGVTPDRVEIRYDNPSIPNSDTSRPIRTLAWANMPTCESAPVTRGGDRVVVRITIPYDPLVGITPSMVLHSSDARTIVKGIEVSGEYTPPPTFTRTPTNTATNTPTPTVTETPRHPTRTPTSTNTPLNTPTETATATVTTTVTLTATPTVTHTATNTSTPTPTAPPCSNLTWRGPTLLDNKLTIDLVNNSSTEGLLRSLTVNWTRPAGTSGQVYLDSIDFGGLVWAKSGPNGASSGTVFVDRDPTNQQEQLTDPNPLDGVNPLVLGTGTKTMTILFDRAPVITNIWITVQMGPDNSFNTCNLNPDVTRPLP